MSQTTNLQLPVLTAAQAHKHITVNEALTRLDALVQGRALSRSVATQPGSPSDGDVYILPSGKTGAAWGGYANGAIAHYHDGVWEEITPKTGWHFWIIDEALWAAYASGAWALAATSAVLDAPTSWALKGDLTPPDITADQNDYSPTGLANAAVLRLTTDAARTLTGIAGGADGRVLVLCNVGSFSLALASASSSSSAANRFALFSDIAIEAGGAAELLYDATASRWRLTSLSGPSCIYDEFTASGTWTKRKGATAVYVETLAGGGGGGGGARTASGNASSGGGAGGGGGRAKTWLKPAALGATESVTIGSGGASGAGAASAGNAGASGGAGGDTSFGAHVAAYGGGAGAGGQLAGASGGGGGGGLVNAGAAGSGGTGGAGSGSGTAGANGGSGTLSGFLSAVGGAGGGGGGANGGGGAGSFACVDGSGGGGAGGGIATSPANTAGGGGGRGAGIFSGASGGTSAAGSAGQASSSGAGGGGGGGGSNAAGVGYAGGAGGPGGGGGGGGSAVGGAGGAGGVGGAGLVRVWTFF